MKNASCTNVIECQFLLDYELEESLIFDKEESFKESYFVHTTSTHIKRLSTT